MQKSKVIKTILKVILSIVVTIGLFYGTTLISIGFAWSNQRAYSWLVIATGIFLELYILFRIFNINFKKQIRKIGLVYLTISLIIGGWTIYNKYDANIPVITDKQLDLQSYMPFQSNDIAKLNRGSDLIIENDFPILDGATALFPVYSAFIEATYNERNFLMENNNGQTNSTTQINGEILKCTTTITAYENLIDGKVDIIFVAGSSKEQQKLAEQKGVNLKFIPIGKEAFVFFVNSKNKVSNLELSQIQDIYSGTIINWKELGGSNQEIKAFQRAKNSGSQTALENLMKGRTLKNPIEKEIVFSMGEIIDRTADYKNYKNSIGFSFRYFATEMVTNNTIKLLAINGVYPSKETIKNKTYALSNDFYAVIVEDNPKENIDKLINWILSEQGQSLIEQTGYVSIY